MGEPVRFIGAGPGDPELITVKGMRYLQEADRVVYAGSRSGDPAPILQEKCQGI